MYTDRLYRVKGLGLLAVSAATVLSNGAIAQQAIEEIIVTAQKRQQTTQDVPAAIAAIGGDQLKKTVTTNFSDLSKITSGITIGGSEDGFAKEIRIRGIGTNSQTPAIRPAVGIFLDEIPLVEPAMAYNNLADIQRIEVLKGPQATLFGKEVSAGAISLFTAKPYTDEIEGYLEGNFGNLGVGEGRAGLNLPLTDKLAARGSIYYREKDSPIEGSGAEGLEANGARLRLGYDFSDNLNVVIGHEMHDTEVYQIGSMPLQYGDIITTYANYYNADAALVAANGPINTSIPDPFDRKGRHLAGVTGRTTDTDLSSMRVEWLINDEWSFTSVSSIQNWNQDNDDSTIIRGDALIESGQLVLPAGSSDVSRAPFLVGPFITNYFQDSKTQEFRLTFEGDELASIVGAFYADSEDGNNTSTAFPIGVIPGPQVLRNETQVTNITATEEWAIFTHNTYNFNDETELTFGIRYSEVKKKSTAGQLLGRGDTPFADFGAGFVTSDWDLQKQTDTWSAITGTLKLNYYLTEDVSAYIGYDRGFKAGGHNTPKDDGTGNVIISEPFDEEYADNIEFGVKSYFLDRTLRFNSSVFYQIYSDFQVDIQDPDSIGNTIVNAAEVIVMGFESDFQWLVNENLSLDGTLSYVDGRWEDYTDASCIRPQLARARCSDGSQDLTGKRINSTSPWTANFNATWNDTFDNGMGWYARGEVSFRDDVIYSADLDPETRQASYYLLNASVGITSKDESTEVIFWGKNLADEEYYSIIEANRDDSNPAFNPNAVAGLRGNPGEERSYGVTLKYSF